MPPVKHPHPFSDLLELSRPTTYDPGRSFKDQLRAIDVLRSQSQAARDEGDLENAYIYLGRAAAVISEHLPSHSQYGMLSAKQQIDLANNGQIMLRSLKELEPQLKERYRKYQEGIANGTIQPPKRRRTGDERETRRRPTDPPPEPVPTSMPRTPTSIEDHTTSRSTRTSGPTPAVSVMLSEAQERERRDQMDRDRRRRDREREYRSSDDDRRTRASSSKPVPESSIPTPIPTPDRRDTSTLSISQTAPSTSQSDRKQRDDKDRGRRDLEKSDRDMRDAMVQLQHDYEVKLAACLSNKSSASDSDRMKVALDIVQETAGREREWIEQKSKIAVRYGLPSTFDKELADQMSVQDQRRKEIAKIFARRGEEAAQRREADKKSNERARQTATAHVAELEARQRHVEAELSRERQNRSDREYSDADRTARSREDQLLHDREVAAAQDAMSRVTLAQQQRAQAEAELKERQRQAASMVTSAIQRGQAERHRDIPSRSSRSHSPIPPPDFSRQASPIPPSIPPSYAPTPSQGPFAPLARPQNSRADHSQYVAAPPPPQPPVSIPATPIHILPTAPPIVSTATPPIRRPQNSRADISQSTTASTILNGSRSPLPYGASTTTSPLQNTFDRDFTERTLHSRSSNIQIGPRSSAAAQFPIYPSEKSHPPIPAEKLEAIAALPIESPSHSLRGSLPSDIRDPSGRSYSQPRSASPPSSDTPLPIAGQSPNYANQMSRHQKSQGYRPTRSSTSADEAEISGGTPNGLLFQPIGVTKVPTDPYAKYNERSMSRQSTNGPYPLPPKLRTIRLPSDTLQRFVALAALNTAKKKETLGVLYGRANSMGGYDINSLVIPKQSSTENTCLMEHEEMLVDYAESRGGAVCLGWIHTHPTQSCFMSSMDLHTHAGFQRTLPEAIAIVCAPRHQPNFGIFRLTDPPGLPLILKCDQTGFHPHPDKAPIYTDADSEHVQMMSDRAIEIVDLR